MSLREKVTEAMVTYAPIPKDKADVNRKFYYARYEDNLFCPLGEQALDAYNNGSGAETRPTEKMVKGQKVISPAKMASVASSSAMTFNLLGNEPATILTDDILPHGTYDVQYEKQMYTVKKGSNPANLDAFLSNEDDKAAIFCEMKMLEWLGNPSCLKEAYLDEKYYFTPDYSAVGHPVDAYQAFRAVIEQLIDHKEKAGYRSIFKRYDVWQMVKHLLAIYNYTSFATQNAVNAFSKIPSTAGKYNCIILANVVNEFPAERIQETRVREAYIAALQEEREEAQRFTDIIMNSKIPHLFYNNCNAGIEVKYITAKAFADNLDMTNIKREYLRRYFKIREYFVWTNRVI